MANELIDANWVLISDAPLPIDEAVDWAITSDCGALTTFYGTVRDYSEGRAGVSHLDYEAYPEQAEPRLLRIAAMARERWPMTGRIALFHRIGLLDIRDIAVFVAAATPHRRESFEVTQFLIDTLKATVPIWKKETWADGSDWGLCDHVVADQSEGDLSFQEFTASHAMDIDALVDDLPSTANTGQP